MLANNDSDWNIEDLTDTEKYAAIHYLEPGPSCANGENGHIPTTRPKLHDGVVICVCLYILVLGGLAFVWFYWR